MKRSRALIPRSADGVQEGTWILADYLDVVLHVFTPEARQYYKLEELWGDVPAVQLEAAAAKQRRRASARRSTATPAGRRPPSRRP